MIPALLGLLAPIVGKVIEKIPTSAEREKAKAEFELEIQKQETELLKVLQASDQSQAEINKEEAKSNNLFVSGWRPSLGWVCSAAFAWVYVGQPFIAFFFSIAGHPLQLPEINFGEMSSVLFGMLGLGGLRTYEKVKGVASK